MRVHSKVMDVHPTGTCGRQQGGIVGKCQRCDEVRGLVRVDYLCWLVWLRYRDDVNLGGFGYAEQ